MARALLTAAMFVLGLLAALAPYGSSPLESSIASVPQPAEVDPVTLRVLQVRFKSLTKQLAQFAPRQPYILVDTARNHLYVKRSQEVVLDAIASTGSGVVLDKPGEGQSQWVFDTPRGEFIEEGLLVPKDPAERVEQGVLGDYALGFGKGYFIHGTLYTRLLGKNVTHGCIRLSDDDLKSVYQLARVDTPIMIF